MKNKLIMLFGLIVLALFLFGCTSQVPICGDNVCSYLEINPDSQYFCPTDCPVDISSIIEGKICKYDNECSRSGYCNNGVCALIESVQVDRCKYNSDCGKGRFCNNGVCNLLISNNDSNLGNAECETNSDCGKGRFCNNGVCNLLISTDNNFLDTTEEENNAGVIDYTTSSGGSSTTVKTEVCKINSDCGKVYQKEALFCVDNLVKQKIITPTCNNLGNCTNIESENTISTCLSTQQCISGKCVEKTTSAAVASCSTKYDCLETEDCVNNTCLKIICSEGFSLVDRECVCTSDTCIGYLADEYLSEENDLGVVENNDLILIGAVALVIIIIIGLVVFFILKKKKEQELEEAMEPNPDGFGNTI